MPLKKNIKVGKIKVYFLIFSILFINFSSEANTNLDGQNTDIKILDKISSKNELIKLQNNQELIYKDLSIKSLKCKNKNECLRIMIHKLIELFLQ